MTRQFEGVFELHDVEVRDLRGGSKLRLIFRRPEEIPIFQNLIYFRETNVKAMFSPEDPKSKYKNIVIDDVFEFYELKLPRKKGHMMFYLEQMYEKKKEIAVIPLRYVNCKVYLESIEQELDFEEEEKPEVK